MPLVYFSYYLPLCTKYLRTPHNDRSIASAELQRKKLASPLQLNKCCTKLSISMQFSAIFVSSCYLLIFFSLLFEHFLSIMSKLPHRYYLLQLCLFQEEVDWLVFGVRSFIPPPPFLFLVILMPLFNPLILCYLHKSLD